MAMLWARCRGGDLGQGRLPESGGVLDQCGWTMEAFDIMEDARNKLKPTEKR